MRITRHISNNRDRARMPINSASVRLYSTFPPPAFVRSIIGLPASGSGKFVEVQGTGETGPFDRAQLNQMLDIGEQGINQLFDMQKTLLGKDVWNVGRNN